MNDATNPTPAASPDEQRVEALMRLADAMVGAWPPGMDAEFNAARNSLRAALASPPVAAQVASPDLSTQQIAYALAQLPTPPKHGGELHDWAELLARELWRHYGPTSQQPTQPADEPHAGSIAEAFWRGTLSDRNKPAE